MKKNSVDTMKYLFEPRSVAIIGASSNPEKIGHSITRNIKKGGFKGAIYPINYKKEKILGLETFKSIHDIDEEIDIASVCVPARFAFEAVKDCADKGVKYIQIITSGFSEIGEVELERQIIEYAKNKGTRILGPNIFGVYSALANYNSTFSATKILKGNVAILTQSGALGIAMIGMTEESNMGLSTIISLGNKADIDEADCLEYITSDDNTRVILMYIEGIKNGERFIDALKKASKQKPVVILKSGRSKRGAMAAASHTGSLAGSDSVFDAIIKQFGSQRAESLEEAFNWCKLLANSPMPKGSNSVIITNGGGIGVMATDACEKFGIDLYDNQDVLKEIFEPATPSFGSIKNPIDITGGATSQNYNDALSAPTISDDIHSTIAIYCETAAFDSENLAPMIRDTYKAHTASGKPITCALVGGNAVKDAISILRKENIPVYREVYQAISSLSVTHKYQRYLKEMSDVVDEAEIDLNSINLIIDKAISDGRNFLLADEGAAVMAAADIAIPKSRIVKNIDEAVQYAEKAGYPLVLKIVSRDILHKSDTGGVALNLLNRNEIIDAYEAVMQNSRAYKPDAIINGIEICEMVQSGTELIVGARKDPSFGPVVMCGLGGIYVEVIQDVVFRGGLPLNREEAMSMLQEIRSFPLLLGVRGEERKDIEEVIDTIIKVATIIKRCRRIADIEINPIVVYEQNRGIKAVDARILITDITEEFSE